MRAGAWSGHAQPCTDEGMQPNGDGSQMSRSGLKWPSLDASLHRIDTFIYMWAMGCTRQWVRFVRALMMQGQPMQRYVSGRLGETRSVPLPPGCIYALKILMVHLKGIIYVSSMVSI